jgi:hypothetical protein
MVSTKTERKGRRVKNPTRKVDVWGTALFFCIAGVVAFAREYFVLLVG